MDAERYYENQRLQQVEEAEVFEQIRQEKYDEFEAEIRRMIREGFGGALVRLPMARHSKPQYTETLSQAIGEFMMNSPQADGILSKAFASEEGKQAFFKAVADYYVEWQCDQLAEVAAEMAVERMRKGEEQ